MGRADPATRPSIAATAPDRSPRAGPIPRRCRGRGLLRPSPGRSLLLRR